MASGLPFCTLSSSVPTGPEPAMALSPAFSIVTVSLIERPTRVEAAGTPPKLIDEYAGRVNTGEGRLSIAHMHSPAGWTEPGQTPEFDEYTLVLSGKVRVEHRGGVLEVRSGQAVLTAAGCHVHLARPADGSKRPLCCGRTFLSVGLIEEARKEAARCVVLYKRGSEPDWHRRAEALAVGKEIVDAETAPLQ